MDRRYPFPPFPTGWYLIRLSSELARGQTFTGHYMGWDIVLYRTASGQVGCVEAYCPHLGAHMGRGGRVEGEDLVCPFHGFRFGLQGDCSGTPYPDARLPKACTTTFPVQEKHGMIFVWLDRARQAPSFEIPALDDGDWTPPTVHRWALSAHPQETNENAVDWGHFATVHGYKDLEFHGDLVLDGPYLNVRYGMRRGVKLMGKERFSTRNEFEIHGYGLGYSVVEAEVPAMGIRTRHFVMAVPTSAEKMIMQIGMSVKKVAEPGRIFPLLAPLPGAWLARQIHAVAWPEYIHDVAQDLDIWSTKVYVHPPRLAPGDGPIMRFRRWCEQFYPPEAAQDAPRSGDSRRSA